VNDEDNGRSDAFTARFETDFAQAQALSDRLAEALDPDACAVAIFESEGGWTVEAVFRDAADRRLIEELMRAAEFGRVEARDWVAASLSGLAPVRAGRFVVHGAHDRGRLRHNEIGIEIEAALAFGTGHHGTTRGCLLALAALEKRGRRKRDFRILDIGTGSGVLAIAAARALRVPVLASDIDPVAAQAARDNARLNRTGMLVTAAAAAGADAHVFRARGPYDLIFANILEAPLRRLSRPLGGLLAGGGRLVLSGLLPAHAAGVVAAYRRQGLELVSRMTLEGWVTLVMRRRVSARTAGPSRCGR
jgi:ribosomal protein L11 methyltransferase